jgi:hypothetical protein
MIIKELIVNEAFCYEMHVILYKPVRVSHCLSNKKLQSLNKA